MKICDASNYEGRREVEAGVKELRIFCRPPRTAEIATRPALERALHLSHHDVDIMRIPLSLIALTR